MNTKHIGDLTITTKAQALKYTHLEEVTGSLDIRADAQLPVLTSVGGYPATCRQSRCKTNGSSTSSTNT